jgi:DNA-binding NarL/FixJ family response regulator
VDVDAGDHTASGPLAKREVEVAKLVAEGLTNRQIGKRLFISERTVATHVRNILNKLGFDSRAQIASWMTSSDS